MDEIIQLFGSEGGIVLNQQASGQDSVELRCPSCEIPLCLETITPTCSQCGFDLEKWSASGQDSIAQTNFKELHRQEMLAERVL